MMAMYREGSMARKLRALFIAGLALALLCVGCAQTSTKDRDLNGEVLRQMSRWGDEPGY